MTSGSAPEKQHEKNIILPTKSTAFHFFFCFYFYFFITRTVRIVLQYTTIRLVLYHTPFKIFICIHRIIVNSDLVYQQLCETEHLCYLFGSSSKRIMPLCHLVDDILVLTLEHIKVFTTNLFLIYLYKINMKMTRDNDFIVFVLSILNSSLLLLK